MPTPRPEGAATFDALGLRPELQRTLAALGYEEPTPIQREAIPSLIAGRDLLGQAATGTGKTAAFALPVLQRLEPGRRETEPMALVLVPTRELAVQVSEAFHRYGRELGARILPIYGGQPYGRQLRALERGVDVVVATPGRVLDHIQRATLKLHGLQAIVLDEADEMLDMGFAEDIETILAASPEGRQTLLFSATMPPRIEGMVRRHLQDPVRVALGRGDGEAGVDALVRQVAYVVPRPYKAAALGRILDAEAPAAAIVFCRTREQVEELTETLNGRGYRAEALHGGMDQGGRERVLARLRAGAADLIVATDVAARGLDVEQLTHVVNHDVPSSPDSYVHRIGRVGRAGRAGVAITLAEPREHRLLKAIERSTGQRIEVGKLPSIADLRLRRLDQARAALVEALGRDSLDRFRDVVEPLSEEFGAVEVALAALALAQDASGTDRDEEEIPEVALPTRSSPRTPRAGAGHDHRRGTSPREGRARLFVGAGRAAGVRPQDLVGAIAGESGLKGRDIGTIEITDRFSLVDVPEAAADEVIAALRTSSIRGRKATVRRDRGPTR